MKSKRAVLCQRVCFQSNTPVTLNLMYRLSLGGGGQTEIKIL
jgi:hypothetical protein